jgi:hypothetical protein
VLQLLARLVINPDRFGYNALIRVPRPALHSLVRRLTALLMRHVYAQNHAKFGSLMIGMQRNTALLIQAFVGGDGWAAETSMRQVLDTLPEPDCVALISSLRQLEVTGDKVRCGCSHALTAAAYGDVFSLANRTLMGWARGDGKWPSKEGQFSHVRGVRVALGTRYSRVRGIGRASRNGRVRVIPHPNPYRYDSQLSHRCAADGWFAHCRTVTECSRRPRRRSPRTCSTEWPRVAYSRATLWRAACRTLCSEANPDPWEGEACCGVAPPSVEKCRI